MQKQRYKKWSVVVALASRALAVQVASAGEEAPVYLDEIVVTATKTEEERRYVPNSVIIVDELDIKESPAQGLGELLANEPGIDWRTYGNYGGAAQEIQIRGMSGSGTQVLVNGMSINSPSFGRADVGQIPLNNIERVEVIKGSSSVLYGSGAIGGVVNIITKRPSREQMTASATAGFGSQETYQVSAEQGMFVWDDLGYFLTANHMETDGFRDNSDLEHSDASLNLALAKGQGFDASLYADYVGRDYGRPGVKPPSGTPSYSINGVTFYNDEAASLLDRTEEDNVHTVLNVKGRLSESLGLNFKSDVMDLASYDLTRAAWSGGTTKTWVDNRAFGNLLFAEARPLQDATLLLGVDRRDYLYESRIEGVDVTGASTGADTDTEETLASTGLFAEGQYRPLDSVNALVGLRNEHHSSFGSLNLPLVGLTVTPWPDTALKMTHGKHFLAPTPNDLFWPEDAWGNKGNPDLKPETGWHSDATVEQSLLDKKVFFSGSYFHWDMENKIQWAPYGTGYGWTPQNLRTYEADGVELGVHVGPFAHFRGALSGTFMKAHEEAQEYNRDQPGTQQGWVTREATNAPERLFKAQVSHEAAFGLLSTITVRYVGSRSYYSNESADWVNYRTVGYTMEPYWVTDIKLEQRLSDNFQLIGQVNNLFDERYDTYLEPFTNQETFATTMAGYPGAGRAFMASLRYTY